MDPAIKQGFVIGLVVAAAAGYFGWRQGWWPKGDVVARLEDKIAPAEKGAPGGSAPGPAAKSEPSPAPGQPAPKAEAAKPDTAKPEEPKPQSPDGRAAEAPPAPAKPSGDVAALSPPAAKPPAEQSKAPEGPKAAVEKGAFDVVRVEPTGEAVVAGRCAANCVVELTANGKVQDKATADPSGNWAMTPPPLPPGDYQLGLKVTGADGQSKVSEQSVTVSIPATAKGEVVVVLNEPNAPSKILQRPGQEPAAARPTAETAARVPAAEAKTPAQKVAAVSIGAVDAEKGRLFVQGTAPAGAPLRVYLNNALIAQPVAGADERWSVRVERGLTPGDYVVRVDNLDKASSKVVARAEARFAYEGEVAAATPPAKAELKPEPKPEPKPDAKLEAEPERPATTAPEPQRGGAAAPEAPGDVAKALPDPSAPAPEPEKPSAPSAAAEAAAPPAPAEGKTTTFAPAPQPADARPPEGERGEGAQASKEPAKPEAPQSPAPDAANPVVASIDTANVRRGDSLWRISRKTYGKGMRYTVIFTANDSQIRDPDLIYPGQVLVLPPAEQAGGAILAR